MPLSATLNKALAAYGIGPKIRALRLAKNLGQVELGEHTGLSAALLSKLERGQLFPTLPTLLRIATVFRVGLDHFFTSGEGQRMLAVTRGKDRVRLPGIPGTAKPPYFFESLNFPANDRSLDAYLAEFPAAVDSSEPHEHPGTELIYVLGGTLQVSVDGRETILGQGDAMHFDSTAPHCYRGRRPRGASALIVSMRS